MDLQWEISKERLNFLGFVPVSGAQDQCFHHLIHLGDTPHQFFLNIDEMLDTRPP